jgi:nucleoside-diphosphate-sugar epimerase
VLVTGATGFVGQHLVRRLLSEPRAQVRVLVRRPERVRELFGEGASRLEIAAGDLAEPASLSGICEGIASVFHAGAKVPYGLAAGETPELFGRVNLAGTQALAREAIRSGVARFVHLSSTAAMGTPHETVVDEATPCRPASAYEISKRAAEETLLALHREQGLGAVILRPCLVAGEGKHGGEFLRLFRLCRRGLFPVLGGRLEVEKPLLMVDDLVQALLRAAGRGPAGEVYLVHSGGRHTLGEILRVAGRLLGTRRPYLRIPYSVALAAAHLTTPVARLLGRPPPLTPGRLRLFVADRRIAIDKARTGLGFAPEHQDLEEMLGRTHAWYTRTGQL